MPSKASQRLLTLVSGLLLALLPSCGLLSPKPVEYDKVMLPSGVVLRDLVVPEKGPRAADGDTVAIEYDLFLEDGEMVDSTADRGRPARFVLGSGDVPRGVEEGVRGMKLFGLRRVIVPPEHAYGDAGLPPRIPPNATLRFELELMELEQANEAHDAEPEASSG